MKKHVVIGLFVLLVSTVVASQPVRAVTVTADYSKVTATIDNKKVLNVARGGHGINTDLTWMPKFYDKLVEIGVDEFRIDWLLSDWFYTVVSRDGSGSVKCDFTKLDKIILPMVQKGIKPVMCMCYMATALGKQDSIPNNFNEYKTVIKAYVKHYKDLGYTGWAWESHNEPEGFTKLTAAQTYQMYEYFATGVKEVDNTARVGGYGSVGHDWIGYARSFLELYKNDTSKPPLDFFSFHQYGKQSWEYVPEIESAFTSIGLTVPDLYITEWNNSYGTAQGEGNSGVAGGGFDTHINAAYIAKKMFNSFDYNNLKKIYFWNFADADPAKKFAGEPGIFTVNTHRKAGANTFYFYKNLFNSRASATVTGDGTSTRDVYGIVTVEPSTKKAAILLWNFQNTTVSITTVINNLPVLNSGIKYKVSKLQIDSINGNYYYDYTKDTSGTATGAHEYARVIDSTLISGTTLSRSDILPRYSVVQFLVQPQSVTASINSAMIESPCLMQVSPAVFNNATTISYVNQKHGEVSLLLIAANGRVVEVLASGIKAAGTYRLQITGDSIKNGLYFMVLKIGNSVRGVKKVIKI